MGSALGGKVALVPGGAKGIGAAVFRRLASEGTKIAFTYRGSNTKALELPTELERSGAEVVAVHCDVSDTAALTSAVNEAAARYGKVDILVNNAGVLLLGPIDDFSLEHFDETVAVNIRAAFVAFKAVLPHMGPGGPIINIGRTERRGDLFEISRAERWWRAHSSQCKAMQSIVQNSAIDHACVPLVVIPPQVDAHPLKLMC